MIVVKVGGSLFDHPGLGRGLRAFLHSRISPKGGPCVVTPPQAGVPGAAAGGMHLSPEVLLVPGGGAVADVVRLFDRIHQLGEETAHWLALRSLSVTAEFLRQLLAREHTQTEEESRLIHVVDVLAFASADETRPGRLPHCWQVTTDSLAARIAWVYGAQKLLLLKSIDIPPATPWLQAARQGWVDAYFPQIAAQLPCPIETINFRSWLEHSA
ncbi:MAG: hypothetical protein RMJ56_14320 [Gemmataceae bacterium]|nr:hypothetical protein [Gemmata sp.]MDW8198769.1 hypothetical protein [Gemmataceae bacterium]